MRKDVKIGIMKSNCPIVPPSSGSSGLGHLLTTGYLRWVEGQKGRAQQLHLWEFTNQMPATQRAPLFPRILKQYLPFSLPSPTPSNITGIVDSAP